MKTLLRDEEQAIGKTVEDASLFYGRISITFTDGTALVVRFVPEYEDMEVETDSSVFDGCDLRNLNLATEDEAGAIDREQSRLRAEKEEAREREQFDRLAKKFGVATDAAISKG